MNKDEILEYYFLAINDIRNGSSIQELEEAISRYMKRSSNTKHAPGILKAINEVKYTTIKNLKNGH